MSCERKSSEVKSGSKSGRSDNEVWQKNQALQVQTEQGEVESVRSTGPAWRRWLRQNSRVSTYLWLHGIRYVVDKVAPTECFTGQFTQMWPVTEEGLNRLKRASGDRPLTIWYLPDQSEWGNERWKAIKDLGDADRFIMRDAVIQWAQQNETAVVDITPVFLGRTQPEVKYRIDGHWNASGHRIVAEAVANDSNASFLQRQTISVEAEPKGSNAGE